MTAPADNLLSRLDGVRSRAPAQWSARCPAHEDRSPSLSVREADDGRVLLHCFAGCPTTSVIESVGLGFSELFPDPLPSTGSSKGNAPFINPWIALDLISFRLTCIAIVLTKIERGETLTPDDSRTLADSAREIQAVAAEIRKHGR